MVPPQLFVTLAPLLSARDEQFLALEIGIVQLVDGALGVFVVFIVDETESLVLARLVELERTRDDGTEGLEETVEFVLGGGCVGAGRLTSVIARQGKDERTSDRGLTLVDVLDVNVGEMSLHLFDLAHPLLFADVVSYVDLFVVEQHAVDGLDGGVGGFGRLVMDEPVAPGTTVLVGGDLAREDVAERGKSVVEGL